MLYRLAIALGRRGVRGSWRFLVGLRKLGLLNRPVRFRLSDSIHILLPISGFTWDDFEIARYESDLLEGLGRFIGPLTAPLTLIDGGADVGMFSLKVFQRYPAITRILAFEPNPARVVWLVENLAGLPVRAVAEGKALSDFEGVGRLQAPAEEFGAGFEMSHESNFLVPAPDGDIPVTRVDALGLPANENLILKLDIEGGEEAALRGAKVTIQAAAKVVIILEAHPWVTKRTGRDPVDCLRLLASWRPFSFVVGEDGTPLETSRPVFEQLPPTQVYNLIGYSA